MICSGLLVSNALEQLAKMNAFPSIHDLPPYVFPTAAASQCVHQRNYRRPGPEI